MKSDSANINEPAASSTKNSSGFWGKLLKYGVPPLMTVGLCWLLFTGVDIKEMIEIIRTQCNFSWLLAGLGISIFSYLFRALRWRIQLKALDIRPPLWAITLSIFGTYAVNMILPRLGELWRTGYIAERERAPFSTVFGSMICDRLSDTITVGLITLFTFIIAHSQILSYLNQNPEAYMHIVNALKSPWLWAALVAVVCSCLWLCRRYPDARPVRICSNLLKGIWQGFAVVAKMPGKGRWLLLTILLWGCYYLQLYLAFFAFPLTAEVAIKYGQTAVLVCFVLSSISMAVPSNGGIGPYQWAIVFGLSMYASEIPGLSKEYATSFANMVMGCQTVFIILLGIITFVVISIDKRRKQKSS
ncbi:MAG: flippase-like domain-containing protein [Roseburia sp.]|nr:flippase-like domain-containing protein [Roseburia sp.]